MAADRTEIRKTCKMGYFLDFGETDDSSDTVIFYFQHNNPILFRDVIRINHANAAQTPPDTGSDLACLI